MSDRQIPWEDTYLTIYNYKEPLLKIPEGKGFGYYGCLLETVDKKLVQCHVCGKLFQSVGPHARISHKLPERKYKEKFQLSPMTALISDDYRQVLKYNTLNYLESVKEGYKEKLRNYSKEGRKKRRNFQPKITLETRNKRGNCPDQLIQKILEVKEKLGRTPSLAEFINETGGQRYKHLIIATFGSWLNALKIAKIPPKTPEITGRGNKSYSDEELIESLTIFAQENRKLPTATDCKRGLLPGYETYQRHFGTFEKARQLAKVYDFID